MCCLCWYLQLYSDTAQVCILFSVFISQIQCKVVAWSWQSQSICSAGTEGQSLWFQKLKWLNCRQRSGLLLGCCLSAKNDCCHPSWTIPQTPKPFLCPQTQSSPRTCLLEIQHQSVAWSGRGCNILLAGSQLQGLQQLLCHQRSVLLPWCYQNKWTCPTQTTSQTAELLLCPYIKFSPRTCQLQMPCQAVLQSEQGWVFTQLGLGSTVRWQPLVQSSLCPICWQASTLLLLASGVQASAALLSVPAILPAPKGTPPRGTGPN